MKEGGFAKALSYSRQKLCKAVFVHSYLNSPCCANFVPLRHKTLSEKTLTVLLRYLCAIFLLYCIFYSIIYLIE